MNAVEKLRELVEQIRRSPGSAESRAAWELAQRLLGRMPVPPADTRHACSTGDLDLLDALVARLESPHSDQRRDEPSRPHADAASPPLIAADAGSAAEGACSPARESSSGADGGIDPKIMDRALRAFRKRIKLAQLSEESTLGGRQLTSGRKSQIHAILPPHEYPGAVWPALERAGKLRHAGQGFYALP